MKNEIIAMLLAGGKGTRLESLTRKMAKPAVFFGGKYRIIDFPLSNCTNSKINIVGVLTQYESIQLNEYIGSGTKWGLDGNHSRAVILPPRQKESGSSWYNGTADAIMHNIDFMDQYDPEYVLILSGDHIYKMDYDAMLQYHKKQNADVTIAVIKVPWEEASRFGIMNADINNVIYEFEEKPKKPKSNLASMGIYIFSYKKLRDYLLEEAKIDRDEHDFGKHILPKMLNDKQKMVAYEFDGYWKDVGTIDSLWQANMDLLDDNKLDIFNEKTDWKIYSEDTFQLPQYIASDAVVSNSLINQGCIIEGEVYDSVIFGSVKIEKGAKVISSVIMPNTVIRSGAIVNKAIVANDLDIKDKINVDSDKIVLVGE
ncbi:MAG: glucose-1-phosphate adenylyltransferase [Bacilli bacterium]|nr:glucose-1-phosphate adenylyltransferase [Bacilli bacterium]